MTLSERTAAIRAKDTMRCEKIMVFVCWLVGLFIGATGCLITVSKGFHSLALS